LLLGVLDDALERAPAGRAEALEARELRLDGDAGRAGGVDGPRNAATATACALGR
jgi:hypothetical protein